MFKNIIKRFSFIRTHIADILNYILIFFQVKIVIRQKDYRDQFQIDSVNSELSLLKNKLQTSEKLIADLSADLREKTHSLSKLEVERTKLLLTANRAQVRALNFITKILKCKNTKNVVISKKGF